jgi:hypothetical protein
MTCSRPIVIKGKATPCGVDESQHVASILKALGLPYHLFQPKAETTKRRAVR